MLSLHSEPTVASVFAPRTTIDPDGAVEGYASLFGEIDHARDIVMRGAFADTLASRGIRRSQCCSSTTPPSRSSCARISVARERACAR